MKKEKEIIKKSYHYICGEIFAPHVSSLWKNFVFAFWECEFWERNQVEMCATTSVLLVKIMVVDK